MLVEVYIWPCKNFEINLCRYKLLKFLSRDQFNNDATSYKPANVRKKCIRWKRDEDDDDVKEEKSSDFIFFVLKIKPFWWRALEWIFKMRKRLHIKLNKKISTAYFRKPGIFFSLEVNQVNCKFINCDKVKETSLFNRLMNFVIEPHSLHINRFKAIFFMYFEFHV